MFLEQTHFYQFFMMNMVKHGQRQNVLDMLKFQFLRNGVITQTSSKMNWYRYMGWGAEFIFLAITKSKYFSGN